MSVPSDTDEYSTTSALPDGTFERAFSTLPQRVMRDGAWVPVDAGLIPTEGGGYATVATPGAVEISGGGSGAFATVVNGATSLALSWPGVLPAPAVSGSTATYPEVFPGVDLRVTASALGGVSETLVVKSADAGANPDLVNIMIKTSVSGASLSADPDGNLTVVDGLGDEVFHAAAPVMWDSSAGSATSMGPQSGSAEAPAASSSAPRTAPVLATLASGSVTLHPDQALLSDPGTVFPVFIDPSWVPVTHNRSGFDWAQQAFPNTSWWDSTSNGDPAVGYQGWTAGSYGENRSFYQFSIGNIGEAQIHSATLNTVSNYTGLFSCTAAYDIVERNAGNINSATTWNHQPPVYSQTATVAVLGANHSNGCPNRAAHFNVASAVGSNADGTITFRLAAKNETNKNYYRRFSPSASLTIDYNWPPNMPTSFAISPAPRNPSSGYCSGSHGWVGATSNVTVSAHVSDPDGSKQSVQGAFQLWDKGGSGTATADVIVGYSDTAGHSSWVSGSGGTVSKSFASSLLSSGHLYGTNVYAYDGIAYGPRNALCYFWYDPTAPSQPSVSSADFNTTNSVLHVGESGSFTVTASDVVPSGANYSGIDHFVYSFTSSSTLTNTAPVALRDLATAAGAITDTPTAWGTHYLFVAAVDAAGNRSATTTYTFYVPDDPAAQVHPGDVDDDGHPDLLGVTSAGPNAGKLLLVPTLPAQAMHAPLTVASQAADAPDGTSWVGAQIAHRAGSAQSTSGARVDDLWALQSGQLWLYTNNINAAGGLAGNGSFYYTAAGGHRYSVPRPVCVSDAATCAHYDSADWGEVTQVIAPGDMDGDGYPDLITVETAGDGSDTGRMWLYYGSPIAGLFAQALQIGSSAWNGYRVVAPGDHTGDGVPDLWAANVTTGHMRLYRTVRGSGDTVSLAAPVVSGGGGFDPADRPLFASPGDADGDGAGDLYTTWPTADGQLWVNPGVLPNDPTVMSLHAHEVVDDGSTGIAWNNFVSLA